MATILDKLGQGAAEIELEYRHERQAAGIRLARASGVYLGRQEGTTKAKPARAHELRTLAEIASALDVSTRKVFRYLRNQTKES